MSEEKKAPAAAPATAKVAVKKTDEKLGFFKRVAKWFRDMKSELKKVVWPSGKQTTKNTGIAIGISFSTVCIKVSGLSLKSAVMAESFSASSS